MPTDLKSIISRYGAEAKAKLANPAATGEPEDQLRAPLETLFDDIAGLCGFPSNELASVGESSISDLHTRPDYAITIRNVLIGFVEVKAPGKGADPRKFKGHDKAQWEKLQSLPNLLYTDGNSFSLWQNGEPAHAIVSLNGDVESSGTKLLAPEELVTLFDHFLRWEPIPPRSVPELAKVTARLCRLLRDEVTEQLDASSPALTALAKDWRNLLFPTADNKQFADGYAQAVTFGLLMARSREIKLADGLEIVGKHLAKTSSLIGTALKLLTDDATSEQTLKTSLGTLTRVLDAVNWADISKGKADAWLYFYEDFLAVYDNKLRKLTGSYYTPPEVVESMVRLVDELLKSDFQQSAGLASDKVTIADPAVGTGTFPLGIFKQIASGVSTDLGEGAVPGAIEAAMNRIIAFEMQLGPFAVAQLRIHAEQRQLIGKPPKAGLRMFVTDTLADPWVETGMMGAVYEPIGESRRRANKIKIEEPITVVIGNPPYKEKAKGRGGWIENGRLGDHGKHIGTIPLDSWQPPADWGVGAHAKHLRNLYVYFWRWATWKVFDHHPQSNTGIVSFITVAGFLNGPGFQKMRDYLRRTADRIWVIDCSPEGHQPDVPTRIFQGVQQPVCIVMASRSKAKKADTPAMVKYTVLPKGIREEKFKALAKLTLSGKSWQTCPSDWRAPFLPEATGDWATFPALDELFAYNGSGVMPGRTWIIAPDADSLIRRWNKLIKAKPEDKEDLFQPHLRNGELGDKSTIKIVSKSLQGYEPRPTPIAKEKDESNPPMQYAFRSFDRQWIIPDNRFINQPNPELWRAHSQQQVYLTAPSDRSPTVGPALTVTSLIPDLHHYNGRGGRAFPHWRDAGGKEPNLPPKLLEFLGNRLIRKISPADFMAYLVAVTANPAYTARYQENLTQPGLRIPLTAKAILFEQAVEIGNEIIWLHTYGERCREERQAGPPRLPKEKAPKIPKDGAIPSDADSFPDEMMYDESKLRLHVGKGFIDNVPTAVWNYEVSGKRVLTQWFSYRKKDRAKPPMGDKRPPSKLCDIQPDTWLAEYTAELINLLHVLGRLVELEPKQAKLLESITAEVMITSKELKNAGALTVPAEWRKSLKVSTSLFGEPEGE
jgi:hypothetical protein